MNMAGHSTTDGPLVLNLSKMDLTQLNVFLKVELPAKPDAPPQPDNYDSLGQFYEAVQAAIKQLNPKFGQLDFQFSPDDQSNYGGKEVTLYDTDPYGAGGIVVADNVANAIQGLQFIINQGEGNDGTRYENPPPPATDPKDLSLAHYYKFLVVAENRPLPQIYPSVFNPITPAYPTQIRLVSTWLDATYCFFLLAIEQTWESSRISQKTQRQNLLNNYFTCMSFILRPVGTWMAQQALSSTLNAGPAFNFFDFRPALPASPLTQLRGAAGAAISSFGVNRPAELVAAAGFVNQLTDLPLPIV